MKRWIPAVLAVVVGVLLLGAWQVGLFNSDPEEVNLAAAVDAETKGGETITSAIAQVSDLAGAWTVRESDATFVGYRIKEILSGVDFTAVGRTPDVSGSLESDGSAITVVDITADLTGLTSDNSSRDGQLRTQALQTNTFPTARFTLTAPIAVDGVPELGVEAQFDAVGQLEIHGVTREVTVPLRATTADGLLIIVGSLDVALADFDIPIPRAPIVASVGEIATMEFSLVFER